MEMEVCLKALAMKSVFVAVFGALGFLYYKFIGCTTGSCPLTSNAYITTGYGALLGLVLSIGVPKQEKPKSEEK